MENKIKEILKKQILLIKPTGKEQEIIDKETTEFVKQLKQRIKKKKINAEVFIGGSLAKDTLIKKNKYDIDIFVRFDKNYKDNELSKILGRLVKTMKARKIHGSRDYYQVKKDKKRKIIFEIVPAVKIAKPEQARNVTDLSYFHVKYINNKIRKNKKLADEIRLAKSFCYAQNCYGAEGYIRGFSGYALELLVCYYGGFLKFIGVIRNKKEKQRIIVDARKFYKNKREVLLELNEAKLQSPIVFVDPTFKERNTLAALSLETLNKFKQACRDFLDNPGSKFFEKQNLQEELRKKYKNLTVIEARTNKQKGDVAGSKLKKFSDFLIKKLKRYFEIRLREFEYDEKKDVGRVYLVLKQKKEIIIMGPQITAVEHLTRFKKKHRKCFIKRGRAYAREKGKKIKEVLKDLRKEKTMKEMGIKRIELS